MLESLESAVARGAKVLGIMKGAGDKADSFHRTRSSPDGGPAIATIRAALADAGIDESGIGYINAHGTSTPENDKMEYGAMSAVFGDRLVGGIPVSSNKSMIGHTLTAAGAVEAVFSLQTMLTGTLPPTINYNNPDPSIVLDVVPNKKRRPRFRPCFPTPSASAGRMPALSWRSNRLKRFPTNSRQKTPSGRGILPCALCN